MREPRWVRAWRIAFTILALAAVVRGVLRDEDGVANALSMFTYQSNTFEALVLLGGAFLAPGVIGSVRWDRLRGAAVMYSVTTFLVYGFLIEGFYNPFASDHYWTSTVLHQVIPAVLVLDLIARPFANRLTWRSTLLWTIYPIAYLVFSLIRGAFTGWYPYDFINPNEVGGYGGVVLYSIAITAGFFAIGSLIIGISNRLHRQPASASPVTVPSGPAPS